MENTWRCARCGHQNLPDATECGKCKHLKMASDRDFESEVHSSYRASNSAVPWLIGAVTFSLIFIIALLCRPKADAQNSKAPLFVLPFSDNQPPAELLHTPATDVLITSSPDRPGQAQRAQGEWHSMAQFQGKGVSRTKNFTVRSAHWRIYWITTPVSKNQQEWYGAGSDFKASIYRNSNEKVGVVANGIHQSQGVFPMKGEGVFYFEISSPHVWAARIEEWR